MKQTTTILIDTREQDPFAFENLASEPAAVMEIAGQTAREVVRP